MFWKGSNLEPMITLPSLLAWKSSFLGIEAILRRTAQESQSNNQQVFTLGRFTFDTQKTNIIGRRQHCKTYYKRIGFIKVTLPECKQSSGKKLCFKIDLDRR